MENEITLTEYMEYNPNFAGYADQDAYPYIYKDEENEQD